MKNKPRSKHGMIVKTCISVMEEFKERDFPFKMHALLFCRNIWKRLTIGWLRVAIYGIWKIKPREFRKSTNYSFAYPAENLNTACCSFWTNLIDQRQRKRHIKKGYFFKIFKSCAGFQNSIQVLFLTRRGQWKVSVCSDMQLFLPRYICSHTDRCCQADWLKEFSTVEETRILTKDTE